METIKADREEDEEALSRTTNSTCPYMLFFYLYLVQGIALSIGGTMPYVYPHLPSYSTLALFAAVTLPFSFKFFLARLQ